MKNKIFSFLEKRLVYKDPPTSGKQGRGGVTASPSEKAKADAEKAKAAKVRAEEAKGRAGIEKEAGKAKAKVRAGAEATKLKLTMEEQRTKALDDMMENLKWWKISIIRRNAKINPDKWNITSEEGLALVKKEWGELGIYVDNGFYRNIFKQLGKSSDKAFLKTGPRRSKEVKYAYKDPFKNADTFRSLTDPDFAFAVDFFLSIKKTVTDQDFLQKKMEESQQKRDEEPIFSEATRVVRENFTKFKNAIKQRDYATAAIYVVGIYAIYKSFKSLDVKKQGALKKYFFWGAALYAGNIFAKNAGYDILQKLGFKDIDADIKGTPLSALYRLDIPGIKDIDANVFRDVASVNLPSLYKQFTETNDPKIQFIDPNQFPLAFARRNFAGLRPSDLSKKTALSPQEKEYKRVGHQLYLLVKAMKYGYEKAMMPKSGISFEKALMEDPILNKSTVCGFMIALTHYVPETREDRKSLLDTSGSKRIIKRLDEVFKNRHLAFTLVPASLKKSGGAFEGSLMDYPIVVKRDTTHNQYLVFFRDDYDLAKGSPHLTTAIAIPFEGNATAAVEKLKQKIELRMRRLVGIFETNSKNNVGLSGVEYDPDGYWKAKLKYKRGPLLKGTPQEVDVFIRTGKDGTSLDVEDLNNEILIHVENVSDRATLFGSLVLSQLVNQRAVAGKATDFGPFKHFYRTKKLRFIDPTPGDEFFEIQIEKVKIKGKSTIKMKFDETTGIYSFVDSGMEEALLGNHNFKHELAESLGQDKHLTGVISSFKRILKQTPKSYFIHLFENVPDWFTEATWRHPFRGLNLSDFTGSIPKNYVDGLVDAKKEFILAKCELALDGMTKFSDISETVGSTLPHAITQLEQLRDKFAALNVHNKKEGTDFSRETFNADILRDLTAVGIKSENYKRWSRKFVDEMFLGFGMDDLSTGEAIKANRLISVFSFYTASIDDPSCDTADTSLSFSEKMMKDIEKVEAAIKKHKEEPKDAKIATETGIAVSEIPSIRAALKEIEKKEKYELYRDYANHVTSKIYTKIQEGVFKKGTPPGPGPWWGIKSFDKFKERPTPSRYELVDTTPRLNMSTDYITLDKYLAASEIDRKKYKKKEDVVLPKHQCKLTFNTKEELQLYFDLIGDKSMDKRKLTDLEEAFYLKMKATLDKLQEDYDTLPAFDEELRPLYMLHFEDEQISKKEEKPIIIEFTPLKSRLATEVAAIESKLGARQYRTITKADQELLIKKRIAHIVEHVILDRGQAKKYFHKASVAGFLEGLWMDSKAFIFGP